METVRELVDWKENMQKLTKTMDEIISILRVNIF